MNAYLLGAGNGLRLRPLTNDFQKCLLPVFGKPILEWWLEAVFRSSCFDKVYVNIHHCADQMEQWLFSYLTRTGNMVKIIDERTKLLGTAGTLYWHGDTDSDFMVVYTDTFSEMFFNMIPQTIESFHKMPLESVAGIATFDPPNDSSAACMTTDFTGKVVEFREKVNFGSLAWAGILFGRKSFFEHIRDSDTDIATDVLPRLCGKMRVLCHVDAYDIGRGLKSYEHFNRNFPKTVQR